MSMARRLSLSGQKTGVGSYTAVTYMSKFFADCGIFQSLYLMTETVFHRLYTSHITLIVGRNSCSSLRTRFEKKITTP
jgi:hypothetical protein